MPKAWSPKDERQYGHIVHFCMRRHRPGFNSVVCKRVAAATVNKRRRAEGRTLSGVDPSRLSLARPLVLGGLAAYLLYKSGAAP